jgi:GDPmannose 4,6-dehydratase
VLRWRVGGIEIMTKALITGVTGQDGSYLAELLLDKGYEVHGLVRRASSFNRSRIEHLRSDPAIYSKRLFLHYGDLSDATTLRRLLIKLQPDEIYHLAGQSHVGLSFELPESTMQEVAASCLTLLEIIRDLGKSARFYHAASSEVFGAVRDAPQNEETPMRPHSPYGCAKAFAVNMCAVYRDAYGVHACSGIAYNHESPRRGENFVTQKIAKAAARAAAGLTEPLRLGNLSAERDWGFAPEYVDAMWRMLQLGKPCDVVLATGRSTSVRDYAKAAYQAVGKSIVFEGQGAEERGLDTATGAVLIEVDPVFFRPAEPVGLVGDASRAEEVLGWRATLGASDVARIMTEAACGRGKTEAGR